MTWVILAALLQGTPRSAPAACRPSRAWVSAGVVLSGPGAWNVRVCPDGQFEATLGAEDQRGRLSAEQSRILRQLASALSADDREHEFGVQHAGARMLLVSVTAESERQDYAVGDDLSGVRTGGTCEAVVKLAAFMHGLLAGSNRAIAPWSPGKR